MQDFLANASSTALLFLMAIPLLGATILIGVVFLTFTRRKKRAQMKHGIQPASPNEETPADESSAEVQAADPSAPPAEDAPEPDLDLNLLQRLDTREGEVPQPAPAPPPEPDYHKEAPLMENQAPAKEATEPVELLRLLRQPQTGQLIVEVAGQPYDKLTSITDKKVGQFILKLTAHLLAFTNGVILTEAGTKSVYHPKVGPVPEPLEPASPPARPAARPQAEPSAPASEPLVPKPPPEAEAAFLASLRSQPVEPPVEPIKKRGFFSRVSEPTPSMPVLNLADEINDIVQTRLRYSSLADTTQINISSDMGGGLGLRIEVNGRIYTSPDEVPDPAVKELIKAAIKEWERS